jgi:hypothetical protein
MTRHRPGQLGALGRGFLRGCSHGRRDGLTVRTDVSPREAAFVATKRPPGSTDAPSNANPDPLLPGNEPPANVVPPKASAAL